MSSSNPLLDDQFTIQWSRLQPGYVVSGIEEAIREAQQRIDALATSSPPSVTFESSFLALENAIEDLSIAWGKVGHLDRVCNSQELRAVYNEMLPKVTEFYAKIPLNEGLWKVLKGYADSAAGQAESGVRRRFMDETQADFCEHGANLPPGKKHRLEEVARELARKTQKYSENVLDSTNAFEEIVDDPGRLKGLPEGAREQARKDAEEKGYGSVDKPVWRFTQHMPSVMPVMQYAEDEALRKSLWEGGCAIGHTDGYENIGLIHEILALRDEKATLLGKSNFADVVLERRMAKTGRRALDFVEGMHQRIKSAFDREYVKLSEFKAGEEGGAVDSLNPWEVAYWSEALRRERYEFDEEELRPYFPIDRVVSGMFDIFEQLFDIVIEERETICVEAPEEGPPEKPMATYPPEDAPAEVWHPEVKYYSVRSMSGEHLGSFYADWHPRESKRSGAWMDSLKTGEPGRSRLDGQRQPHLGVICGNLTPALDGKPALLTHREVETIFHEFGHLIHHLLGDVEIKSLNGINVAWDFVELPSQIMENWCWERESLDRFARHYETDTTIPEDLFQKMRRARNFHSGMAAMRQLSFGKLDLELHLNYAPRKDADLDEQLESMLEFYQPPLKTRGPTIIRRFSHLFSSSTGYAAGYYSYKWAEVLDADAFTRFQAEGVLNRDTGLAFRETILSKGNSEDPATLFRDFLGRDPDPNSLLVRSGLA